MLNFHSVRAGIIEGGIAFLLLFAPFAFGGVETWAQGVIQIVCGAVFVAWVWRYDDRPPDRSSFRIPGVRLPTLRGMWVVYGLFVALVVFQLIPLPASWVTSLKRTPGMFDIPRYVISRSFSISISNIYGSDPVSKPSILLNSLNTSGV